MPRFLLKLSGEALGGGDFGIDPGVLERICTEVRELHEQQIELAVVLGGGNLFRGQKLAERGMDRVVGDRMGMLATVMNGLAFADFLQRQGTPARVFSAQAIAGMTPAYHRDEVRAAMQAGEIAILTGGTGNPFFTTDTAACLRGIELSVDAVLKATNVDGVYDADPRTHADAKRFATVTYDEVLGQALGVMDLTAIVLCKEQNMPVVVFNVHEAGSLARVVKGDDVGTRVTA